MSNLTRIKNWLVRGDCHGKFDWVDELRIKFPENDYVPAETALIILGDAGINFYLNKTDRKLKQRLQDSGYTFYCVRGNHEQRPELIDTMALAEDHNVKNVVYIEKEFPNIRYFLDGGEYNIAGFWCLVIGGAYSVDKYYRLSRVGLIGNTSDELFEHKCMRSGWFPHEQLTQKEMDEILREKSTKDFDFILSHTCPRAWEPVDLFLNGLDQSSVDKSMENWMDKVKDEVNWKIWLFGHYHADRIERPHVEQYFNDIEDILVIFNRWYGDKTFKDEWWLTKAPAFYQKGDTPYNKDA